MTSTGKEYYKQFYIIFLLYQQVHFQLVIISFKKHNFFCITQDLYLNIMNSTEIIHPFFAHKSTLLMFSVVNNQFYSYFKLHCQVENKYFSVKCKSDSNKRHDCYYPAVNHNIRFFTRKKPTLLLVLMNQLYFSSQRSSFKVNLH